MRNVNKFLLISFCFFNFHANAANKTSFNRWCKNAVAIALGSLVAVSNPVAAQSVVHDLTTKGQCTNIEGRFYWDDDFREHNFFSPTRICGHPTREEIEKQLRSTSSKKFTTITVNDADCSQEYIKKPGTDNHYWLVDYCVALEKLGKNPSDLGIY